MLPKDFAATFNEAIKSQDWMLVSILGEQAISEKSASSDVLYNLGLAYLKLQKPAMATAVLVSIPVNKRDDRIKDALTETLRRSGSSTDDLSMGAHGAKGSIVSLAESVSVTVMQSACLVGLAVIIFVLLAYFFSFLRRYRLGLKFLLIGSCIVVVFSAAGYTLASNYKGHWGAVVSQNATPIRRAPGETTEVLSQLNSGKAVLVLGETRGPWLRVLDAEGQDGWVSALDLRVVNQSQD